jgi:hypothetical protein
MLKTIILQTARNLAPTDLALLIDDVYQLDVETQSLSGMVGDILENLLAIQAEGGAAVGA